MQRCEHCGNEMANEAVVCTKCGIPLKSEEKNSFSTGFIILFVIGMCGVVFSVFTILTDLSGTFLRRYTYTPPFTEHEITILAILIIFIAVAAFAGSCIKKEKK